ACARSAKVPEDPRRQGNRSVRNGAARSPQAGAPVRPGEQAERGSERPGSPEPSPVLQDEDHALRDGAGVHQQPVRPRAAAAHPSAGGVGGGAQETPLRPPPPPRPGGGRRFSPTAGLQTEQATGSPPGTTRPR